MRNHDEALLGLTMFVLLTVHGGFSPWSQWSHCAVTCGGALKRRQRSCSNPKPMFGGRNCLGERLQTRRCGTEACSGETTIRQRFKETMRQLMSLSAFQWHFLRGNIHKHITVQSKNLRTLKISSSKKQHMTGRWDWQR